jgi:hypothetical protein
MSTEDAKDVVMTVVQDQKGAATNPNPQMVQRPSQQQQLSDVQRFLAQRRVLQNQIAAEEKRLQEERERTKRTDAELAKPQPQAQQPAPAETKLTFGFTQVATPTGPQGALRRPRLMTLSQGVAKNNMQKLQQDMFASLAQDELNRARDYVRRLADEQEQERGKTNAQAQANDKDTKTPEWARAIIPPRSRAAYVQRPAASPFPVQWNSETREYCQNIYVRTLLTASGKPLRALQDKTPVVAFATTPASSSSSSSSSSSVEQKKEVTVPKGPVLSVIRTIKVDADRAVFLVEAKDVGTQRPILLKADIDVAAMEREAGLLQKFQGLMLDGEPIVPTLYDHWKCPMDLSTLFGNNPNAKPEPSNVYFVLMDVWDGSFDDLVWEEGTYLEPGPRSSKPYPSIQLLARAFRIAYVIGMLGIIHGDLKLDQFLYRRKADGSYTLCITDFGFSGKGLGTNVPALDKFPVAMQGWPSGISGNACPSAFSKIEAKTPLEAAWVNLFQLELRLLSNVVSYRLVSRFRGEEARVPIVFCGIPDSPYDEKRFCRVNLHEDGKRVLMVAQNWPSYARTPNTKYMSIPYALVSNVEIVPPSATLPPATPDVLVTPYVSITKTGAK